MALTVCKFSLKNPTDASITCYKKYRNLYAKTIIASKKLYFEQQLLKYQSDSKKTWEILRKAINNSNKSDNSIQSIIVDGNIVENPAILADKFNEFFTNSAEKIVQDIYPSNIDVPIIPTVHDPFSFSSNPLTLTEIQETIEQLKSKNTHDSDGLSSNFVKSISLTLSKLLLYIFTKSFNEGVVPTQLKISKIIPLFKSGDRSSIDNYCPIALLSTFSKILEKIVCNRVSIYLENNELLSNFQFGFRKNHSTLHPMVLFMNKITEALENKQHTLAIFCNLRKAFDSCITKFC